MWMQTLGPLKYYYILIFHMNHIFFKLLNSNLCDTCNIPSEILLF